MQMFGFHCLSQSAILLQSFSVWAGTVWIITGASCLVSVLSDVAGKKKKVSFFVVPWRIVLITLNGTIGLKVKQ